MPQETLLVSSPHRRAQTVPRFYHEHFSPVREFFTALADRYTYSLGRNPFALFGLLWGLPIPFFSVAIDLWASGRAWEHPIHLFFLVHPFLFAAVFGAMGTVRREKERRIAHLMSDLRKHVDDLATANGRLKELDHMKARFIANVTHELKTPLVAIRGFCESVLEGPITPKQEESLRVALRNADRLRALVNELLDFERMESGEMKISPSDFDLVPLVHALIKTFQPEIDRRALAVKLNLPDTVRVRADRERIARVFLNLLSNAVKFSPEGKAIGINFKIDREKGRILLSLWDQGPGIPTDAQKYLFTRFWQGEGKGHHRHGGTGLGLAIVKGILNAHDSMIEVLSSQGTGTTVIFDLPLTPEA